MPKLPPTPEATIGPFYPGAFVAHFPQDLTRIAPLMAHRPCGRPIALMLRFLDAARKPVPSLIVETWQANVEGNYRHPQERHLPELDPQFDGFARLRTDANGACTLWTIKPGPSHVGDRMRAPHIRLTIFASGIDRLCTQVFFADEALNESDPVLNAVSDARVRQRLVARLTAERDGVRAYEMSITLRGEDETPFFAETEESDG